MHGLILFYEIDKTDSISDDSLLFYRTFYHAKGGKIKLDLETVPSRWVIRTEHFSIAASATAIVSNN